MEKFDKIFVPVYKSDSEYLKPSGRIKDKRQKEIFLEPLSNVIVMTEEELKEVISIANGIGDWEAKRFLKSKGINL